MRLCVVITAICLCIVGLSVADDVHASIRKQTNIPAEGLGPALQTLAKERNFQIVFVSEEVDALHTQGAIGEFTPEEALKQLLKGTGLTYRFFGDNAISIIPVTSASSPSTSAVDSQPSPRSNENISEKEGAKSNSFRLAQANQGTPQKSSAVASDVQSSSGSAENSPQLTEILVTAQKKEERLRDVPMAISVVDTNELATTNQVHLKDYATDIPGLAVQPASIGQQTFSIRGITPIGGNSNTIITIDDMPLGPVNGNTGSIYAPDIDPGDLVHIEVLKGPQGTLYGASSEGGLIRIVTKDPSTTDFSGHFEAGGSTVQNGSQFGYSVRGAVNVPVNDTFAIAASGYGRTDPGYIDNLTYKLSGVNRTDEQGGRVALLWLPDDKVSVKVGAIYQHLRSDGPDIADGPSGLTTLYFPGLGGNDRTDVVLSAVVRAELPIGQLTSVSGYTHFLEKPTLDDTVFFGNTGTFGPNYSIDPAQYNFDISSYYQEIRLAGHVGDFEWVGGGAYSYGLQKWTAIVTADDPLTGKRGGTLIYSDNPTNTDKNYSAFVNLTYHLTSRMQFQFGVRDSEDEFFDPRNTLGGAIFQPPVYTIEQTVRSNSVTYLGVAQYAVSENVNSYFRYSTGFRLGGPNQPVPGIPPTFAPDTTENYEVGIKGDLFDKRLSIQAALYYIDWSNFQLSVLTPIGPYTTNAGNAKSEGVEFGFQFKPSSDLSVSGSLSYDDAVLTQNLPVESTVEGRRGEMLPGDPAWSAVLSTNKDLPLWNGQVGFIGATIGYVGHREGAFTPNGVRTPLPAYTKADLRAGVRSGLWTLTAYVNNVGDSRGLANYNILESTDRIYITPRTVGFTVQRSF